MLAAEAAALHVSTADEDEDDDDENKIADHNDDDVDANMSGDEPPGMFSGLAVVGARSRRTLAIDERDV